MYQTDNSAVFNSTAENFYEFAMVHGIEDILADKNTYVKVFNISGTLVYEGIYSEANLVRGYYIVVCDGKNIKVKVK